MLQAPVRRGRRSDRDLSEGFPGAWLILFNGIQGTGELESGHALELGLQWLLLLPPNRRLQVRVVVTASGLRGKGS